MRLWMDEVLDRIETSLRAGSCGAVVNLYESALRRCGETGSLEHGRRVHSHIVEHGHAKNLALCEFLLQMYAKCGQVDAAKSIFDSMHQPRPFCWNVMIGAYGRYGRASEALRVYHQMMDEKVRANDATFASVLAAVAVLKDVNQGIDIQKRIDSSNRCSSSICIALINMYSKCHRTDLAAAAFQRFRHSKDVACWNAMVTAFAQNGHSKDAVSLFRDMVAANVQPDAFTYMSALSACASIGPAALETGRAIHETIKDLGDEMQGKFLVENALIGMYSKCGKLDESRQVFDSMVRKDVVSWTTIVTAYAQHGQFRTAIDLYGRMDAEGVQPDEKTMASVVTACANLGALEEGRAVHSRAITSSRLDSVLQNALINMYAKCNSLREASVIFDSMGKKRDVISWTAMIAAYARNGHPQKAVDLYRAMQSESNIRANQVTFLSVLAACSALGDLEQGRAIHEQIRKTRFASSSAYFFAYNALIDMYAKCSDLVAARNVFDGMRERDVVSWTILIAAYAHFGYFREALDLYQKMKIRPDVITFATILGACSNLGSLKDAAEIHARVVEAGMDGEPMLQNALVHMYAKCGNLSLASNIFESFTNKNAITWTSMIAGYAQQGHCSEALELYRRMNIEGLSPSVVTFVPVLIACSHGGLVEDAIACFHSISTDFGMDPVAEHYGCIIDVFGRSGRLKEAEELLRAMPFEPDEVAWQTLLSACKLHKNVEGGRIAAENVLELVPENTASYMLLSNMFTAK